MSRRENNDKKYFRSPYIEKRHGSESPPPKHLRHRSGRNKGRHAKCCSFCSPEISRRMKALAYTSRETRYFSKGLGDISLYPSQNKGRGPGPGPGRGPRGRRVAQEQKKSNGIGITGKKHSGRDHGPGPGYSQGHMTKQEQRKLVWLRAPSFPLVLECWICCDKEIWMS